MTQETEVKFDLFEVLHTGAMRVAEAVTDTLSTLFGGAGDDDDLDMSGGASVVGEMQLSAA